MLHDHREELAVLATFVGIIVASIVAAAALKQARTAAQQAKTARERHEAQTAADLRRHEAQTEADLQRRITENYTKAVEQLGSDKLQVRIGGIFTLERISKESARDYWTVMETLTAFVRDQARWEEPDDTDLSRTEARTHEPRRRLNRGQDTAAVLTIIKRRSKANREREKGENWRLNFVHTDLRRANLIGMHLEGAVLDGAHLEGAHLDGAHLEGAHLIRAHLEGALLHGTHLRGALLIRAHLRGAFLIGAHLRGANLTRAHLEGAHLYGAHLEGAALTGAHLEGAHLDGACLRGAHHLTQDQIESAIGDAETILPTGLTRPAHWTAAAEDGAQAGEGRG